MLSPSDYNSAVPQFVNGEYASNPINPLYIEEPTAVDYNRGVEPLQTLPAQWWNWFGKQFTSRFNKLNIYVKNIFNELAQLLSLVSISPDGTEESPTVGQLKTMFQTEYPKYMALLMYPVGSLYWTGKAPNDGGDPNELFGGTWVQIKGMFVFAKGDSDVLNATGGAKTVTLSESNLPSHRHSFTPSGTISGGSYRFDGSSVNTGGMSGNSSGTFDIRKITGGSNLLVATSGNCSASDAGSGYNVIPTQSATNAARRTTINVAHYHSVTAAGTITITGNPSFSGSASNTGYIGSGTAVDKMPPYIVKYCWERTA